MNVKQKILLCHNYYTEGGGESSVFENEVTGLTEAGHSTVRYIKENSELKDLNFFERIKVFGNGYYSRQNYKEVITTIRREKPDIAIVQNIFPMISPSIIYALSSQNIPILQAVYNYRFVCPDAHLYSKGSICERCITGNYINCVFRRCYRNSYLLSGWYSSILWIHRYFHTFSQYINAFMVPDKFLESKLVKGGIPSQKIFVNANPFFVNEYSPTANHEGYFLYLGRFIPQKGILTLLGAMRRVNKNVKLVISGMGILEGEIKAAIARENLGSQISLIGPCWGEDAKSLISKALAVIVPSEWYDNLPLIICQSNASGKPVIASRINGIPEYVHDNLNGFLFEPGDTKDLADKMMKVKNLSSEMYQKISISSRIQAEKMFDYSEHYRKLKAKMDYLTGARDYE